MHSKDELLARLRSFGQEHLLAHWDQLPAASRAVLENQIATIDFAAVQRFVTGADQAVDWPTQADRAQPPQAVRLAATSAAMARAADERGAAALRAGKVGMILVAGGQGTRLGFPHPKGMFPIGPVSQRTLFEVLIDRLLAVAQRHGVAIPLYVMTSDVTHAETEQFFRDRSCLGLAPEDVRLFCQGMLPAVDRATGKVLLDSRGAIALSPDGHGGLLAALAASGCLADARRRGIELLFYGQIDNPLLQACEPRLIGHHLLAVSEMTTQVVQKRHALERVGNVVALDGRTQIIEYSDLPEAVARRTNTDGSLQLWAGNLAVHVFDMAFLERQVANSSALPIHHAIKKVPYLDAAGRRIEPAHPNALKFERFIFDLLPQAENALVVEADPAEAFAPVKNSADETVDTAATAQAAMIHRDAALLRAAGAIVAEGTPVEVNPRWALDAREAAMKLDKGQPIRQPTYFS